MPATSKLSRPNITVIVRSTSSRSIQRRRQASSDTQDNRARPHEILHCLGRSGEQVLVPVPEDAVRRDIQIVEDIHNQQQGLHTEHGTWGKTLGSVGGPCGALNIEQIIAATAKTQKAFIAEAGKQIPG